MPLQATAGAATYDAFGGGVTAANYIEDVFQTWLYTGNGSTQTITNGVDLSGKGGLVWIKERNGTGQHALFNTVRGNTKFLRTNATDAETTTTTAITSFNSNGFSLGNDGIVNSAATSNIYVSWTFRKQPKFFDVVTYTGNGSNRTIAHSLGSTPGCIIIKRTDTTSNWCVYHQGLATPTTQYGIFNDYLGTPTNSSTIWNSTAPTSTVFSVGTDATVNASGGTYVAYIFAHNAGGFGLTGTDNVITCGSFTTDGSGNATISLGYEPQWLLVKDLSSNQYWQVVDTMRGLNVTAANAAELYPSASQAETVNGGFTINSTGFGVSQYASTNYIYIAIRRGPMRTPTSGAQVYNAIARTGTGATATVTGVGFAPDLVVPKRQTSGGLGTGFYDRLRGRGLVINSATTDAEVDNSTSMTSFNMDGISVGPDGSFTYINTNTVPYINWFFRRAPGFFDVVCYTGTGSATTFSHNLGAVPELMIVKRRSAAADWWVYDAATGNTKYQVLNSTATPTTSSTAWNNTTPTSSVFTVGTGTPVNASAGTYVAYLFATVAGVSKVFSYTGNGSSQTINCGFTAGARFVLIKRTDSTGDWYVWDSARGIVASNDPHLSLNTTAAEVTTDDSVDTDNTGFVVNQVAATNVNISSATYIGLAIA